MKTTTQSRFDTARSVLPTFALAFAAGLFLLFGSIAGPVGSQVDAKSSGPQLALAIEAQRSLIEETPTDAGLYSDLGNLMALDQQWVGAEEAYRSSLGLAPDFVPAQFNLALLLQRKGEPIEALALLDTVVAAQPDHAWAHYQRGRIFQADNDRRAAIDAYADAFAADPELTFPDINPHLTENPYATEAILKVDASRIPISPDTAPRTYDNASRIVQLLIPLEPTRQNSEVKEEDPTSLTEAAQQSAGGSTASVEPNTNQATDSNKGRTLGNGDLEGLGSLNQATPQPDQGGSGSSGRVTTPRGVQARGGSPKRAVGVRPGITQEGVNQPRVNQGGATIIQPQEQVDPNSGSSDTPEINRSRPRPSPGTNFRPGSRSSAQLELKLERSSQAETSPAP